MTDDLDPTLAERARLFDPVAYERAARTLRDQPRALTADHILALMTVSTRQAAEAIEARIAAQIADAAAAPAPAPITPADTAHPLAAIIVKTIRRALAPRDERLAGIDSRLDALEAGLDTLRHELEDLRSASAR